MNSRVYFLVFTNTATNEAKLFEAYRIADDLDEIIINEIGNYFDTSFHGLTKTFIWERRKDLNGYEFSVVALPYEPFLNFKDNVSSYSIVHNFNSKI